MNGRGWRRVDVRNIINTGINGVDIMDVMIGSIYEIMIMITMWNISCWAEVPISSHEVRLQKTSVNLSLLCMYIIMSYLHVCIWHDYHRMCNFINVAGVVLKYLIFFMFVVRHFCNWPFLLFTNSPFSLFAFWLFLFNLLDKLRK